MIRLNDSDMDSASPVKKNSTGENFEPPFDLDKNQIQATTLEAFDGCGVNITVSDDSILETGLTQSLAGAYQNIDRSMSLIRRSTRLSTQIHVRSTLTPVLFWTQSWYLVHL